MRQNDRIALTIVAVLLATWFTMGTGGGVVPDEKPGPRAITIYRESAETTPRLAATLTDLRSGPEADYLKQHKHQLSIVDDNSANRIEIAAKEKTLYTGDIPKSGPKVIELIKRHGG